MGLIISPDLWETSKVEHFYELKLFNYPFVLLENIKGIPANIVTVDNIEAIREAVKYLMGNGHTKIVHFAGPPLSSQTRERIKGFMYAFIERHSLSLCSSKNNLFLFLQNPLFL